MGRLAKRLTDAERKAARKKAAKQEDARLKATEQDPTHSTANTQGADAACAASAAELAEQKKEFENSSACTQLLIELINRLFEYVICALGEETAKLLGLCPPPTASAPAAQARFSLFRAGLSLA